MEREILDLNDELTHAKEASRNAEAAQWPPKHCYSRKRTWKRESASRSGPWIVGLRTLLFSAKEIALSLSRLRAGSRYFLRSTGHSLQKLAHGEGDIWKHEQELGEPLDPSATQQTHNRWVLYTAQMEAYASKDSQFFGLILRNGDGMPPDSEDPQSPGYSLLVLDPTATIRDWLRLSLP
jgi:hypothetical protein